MEGIPGGREIKLAYRIFVDQVQPTGYLTQDIACHACWYFYLCAETNRRNVGSGIESQVIEYNAESLQDIPLWQDKRYNAIAKGIALMYGLDSPDDFAKFWPNVSMEARRLDMPIPADEYRYLTGKDIIT